MSVIAARDRKTRGLTASRIFFKSLNGTVESKRRMEVDAYVYGRNITYIHGTDVYGNGS